MIYKGLSGTSLLNSYTTERLPVIADMLGRTTAIMDESAKFKSTDPSANPHMRPLILNQLGVNCRWSPILVDDQPEAKEASRAGAYLLADPTVLFAGDRAPDAPGLVDARKKDEPNTTTLFDIFEPTKHVVLIFAKIVEEARPILLVLSEFSALATTKVIILPQLDNESSLTVEADFVLVDKEGYARVSYPPVAKGFPVIVVRPDGVIGAVVKNASGMKQYFDGILSLAD